jgi:CDP-diacylglycerol---serine O-phosphatidyltransferase
MKKHIPNFITSLNLTCGFFAIIFAASGDIVTGSWLIVGAMVFDFFDGFFARLLKSYSDIGKELDSLADVVSFGVAPGIVIYQLLNDSLKVFSNTINNNISNVSVFILIIISVMPVCAAIRLAIFNIDKTQSASFKGLPTPANALAVVSIVIAEHYTDSEILDNLVGSPISLLILTIILSLLMISRIPLLSLKFKDLKLKGNEGRYILLLTVFLSFILLGITAAPLIIPIYLIASFLSPVF